MRGPDFIIGGAPKCATTSLHVLLDQHPHISIPKREIGFFDADDPLVHPEYFRIGPGGLVGKDATLEQYCKIFSDFDAPCLGEDSTTYLQSETAAVRIGKELPNVKMIFMLRHPVERAYSQYWHRLLAGRTSATFEEAIRRHPGILLGSSYLSGLKRFRDHLPETQIKVLLFEDFTKDPLEAAGRTMEFLGLRTAPVAGAWANRTRYPRFPRLIRACNLAGSRLVRHDYRRHLETEAPAFDLGATSARLYRSFLKKLPRQKKPPAIRPETRRRLEETLSNRNAGLSEFLGRDLADLWSGLQI